MGFGAGEGMGAGGSGSGAGPGMGAGGIGSGFCNGWAQTETETEKTSIIHEPLTRNREKGRCFTLTALAANREGSEIVDGDCVRIPVSHRRPGFHPGVEKRP